MFSAFYLSTLKKKTSQEVKQVAQWATIAPETQRANNQGHVLYMYLSRLSAHFIKSQPKTKPVMLRTRSNNALIGTNGQVTPK